MTNNEDKCKENITFIRDCRENNEYLSRMMCFFLKS